MTLSFSPIRTQLAWPRRPRLYEIHTFAWLEDIGRELGRRITLGEVPAPVWDAIAAHGFDAIWFMGVWKRSPAARSFALNHPNVLREFRQSLPDFIPEDAAGSAYSIQEYSVDPRLGGREGLAAARQALAERGIRLVLDYVPNHTAQDHDWVISHPEYYIRGNRAELRQSPDAFFSSDHQVIARGRDPYFPPWADVAQLNAFNPGLRAVTVETLRDIASQCDGVRCDMAMLMINRIFASTWGSRAGQAPEREFWSEIIPAVKAQNPNMLFIAEAYWDTEAELHRLGFDYAYDKRLYDRLVHEDAASVRAHLIADPAYQDRLIRFIENHDEPRAAATLPGPRGFAAAAVAATLPGAVMFHDGQFEARKVKTHVLIGRRVKELADLAATEFYRGLLREIASPVFREGVWRPCDCLGRDSARGPRELLAWGWEKGEQRVLVTINYSDTPLRARLCLPRGWEGMRFANGLRADGSELSINLPAWGVQFLHPESSPLP